MLIKRLTVIPKFMRHKTQQPTSYSNALGTRNMSHRLESHRFLGSQIWRVGRNLVKAPQFTVEKTEPVEGK